MCGVFGFVSEAGDGPDMSLIRRIATVTERRGRHAFGFAWIDERYRLRMFKSGGAISDKLDTLDELEGARMIIGHCRFATQGTPADNSNNHPHPVDGGWFVHNGMIPNWRDVARDYGLAMTTNCDSEVLGLLIEQMSGSLTKRVAKAVRAADGEPEDLFWLPRALVVMALWKPGKMVVIKRGNPLSFATTDEGTYMASLSEGMPKGARAVRDNSAHTFSLSSGCKFHPLNVRGS